MNRGVHRLRRASDGNGNQKRDYDRDRICFPQQDHVRGGAEAVALGVWNHVPGDGREEVVSLRETSSVMTENGRFVSYVDISSSIKNPREKNTSCFSTSDASGATSTAASIQRAWK